MRVFPKLLIVCLPLYLLVSYSAVAVELSSKIEVQVGKRPNKVVVSDLDNDGQNEVIVSNQLDGTISVFQHLSAGAKINAKSYRVGVNPTEVVFADINGDDFVDAVIANHETSSFRVIFNDKHGGFIDDEAIDIPVSTKPHIHTLAVADFNHDKLADVVIDSWRNSELGIYFGSSKGGFEANTTRIVVKEQPRTNLVVADLDGDGKTDIITPATQHGGVSVVFGKNLTTAVFFSTAVSPFSVTIADTNIDDHLDIITVHRSGNVNQGQGEAISVLLGDGRGAFTMAVGFPVPISGAPSSAGVGDIDGDGWPEIVTSNYRSNDVTVLSKAKNESRYKIQSFAVGSRPEGIAVADIDGDQISEVIVANRESNDISLLRFVNKSKNTPLPNDG